MLEWSRTYGEIYSLKLGSTTVIVLSSADVVTECVYQVFQIISPLMPIHQAIREARSDIF